MLAERFVPSKAKVFSNWRVGAAALATAVATSFNVEPPTTSAQNIPDHSARHAASRIVQAINDQDADFLLSVISPDFFVEGLPKSDDKSRIIRSSIQDKPACLRYQFVVQDTDSVTLLLSEFPQAGSLGFMTLRKENSGWKISDIEEILPETWLDDEFRKLVDNWDACPIPSKDSYITGRMPFIEKPPFEHQVFPDGRKRYLYVSGMTTTIFDGGAGKEASNLFSDFQTSTRAAYNITGSDILYMSWGGWRINPDDGLLYLSDQSCEDTLRDPRQRAREWLELFLQWFAYHPNDHMTVITHSEGVQPSLFAMELIKEATLRDSYYLINPAKIDFVFTHAPALGINRGVLLEIGAKFIDKIPKGCKIPFTEIPVIGVLDQPTGKNLTETWDNRAQRAKQILSVVSWWRSFGSVVGFVGNYQDQVISDYGWMPKNLLALWLKIDPRTEIIKTQAVPGATGGIHFLGHDGFGHSTAWSTPRGRTLIADQVWQKERG